MHQRFIQFNILRWRPYCTYTIWVCITTAAIPTATAAIPTATAIPTAAITYRSFTERFTVLISQPKPYTRHATISPISEPFCNIIHIRILSLKPSRNNPAAGCSDGERTIICELRPY